MADNLESYFKKHLSDETSGEGNWNVPSDDVWNKAAPLILKKSGLFIRWIYIYIIGALLVAGLAIIFWPSSSPEIFSEQDIPLPTKNIEPSINESSNTTTVYPEQSPNESSNTTTVYPEQSPNESLNTITVYPEQSPNEPSNTIAVYPEQSPNESPNTTIIYSEQSSSDASSQTAQSITNIARESPGDVHRSPADNKVVLSNNDNTIISTDQFSSSSREGISISILPSRAINFITTHSSHIMPDTTPRGYPRIEIINRKPKPQPFNNKKKLAIGVYFAPTYNSTYVSGDLSSGEIETGSTFLYSSNWGIELKYFISDRFAVVVGYERSEIKSWSRSLVDFEYDASTEHTMPEGDKENTSAVPMQTPFGEIGTEITYQFSGDQTIIDGETMQSAMETHQEILYFSIPLGIEYNFIRFSRLNWFGEGGLRYNRALKDGTNYSSKIIHQGDDMDVVNEVMTGHPNYTKNFLSFYVGTGVNWQFSESFQISGSTRYFGNITKVNFQDNLSTYVHGFNLKLGIIYIF